MKTTDILLPDEGATRRLGASLSQYVRRGNVVVLKGDLGAGKTVLARGFIQALLGEDAEVTSPTFTLVQIYTTSAFEVWHTDLYRLEAPSHLAELGLEDAFDEAVCLIEWPDRLGALIPDDRLEITLSFEQDGHVKQGRNVPHNGGFEQTPRRAHITPYGIWKDR